MHSRPAENSNSQPPPPVFLSSNSNMWEHAAYVWRATFIIHAGSQFEWWSSRVILEDDSEQRLRVRELVIFFCYSLWIWSVWIIQFEHSGLTWAWKLQWVNLVEWSLFVVIILAGCTCGCNTINTNEYLKEEARILFISWNLQAVKWQFRISLNRMFNLNQIK